MTADRENKSVQLLRLMELLCKSPRRWRVVEMAAAINENKRNVYRYLQDLRHFLPLTDDGKGRYWVEGQALLASLNLTAQELTVILLSLNAVRDGYLRTELQGVVERIKRTLGASRERHLEQMAERIGASLPVPSRQEAATVLAVVSEAVARSRRVEVEYRSLERLESSVRKVEPMGMWFHDGACYFRAFDHQSQAQRTFRLSRVLSARPLEEFFAPCEFSPQEAAYHPWDPPQAAGRNVEVTLTVNGELARWLAENPAHPTQRIHALEGDRFRVVVRVGDPAKMLSWVAGLREAEVVGPESLRAALIAHLKSALGRH